MRRHVFITAGTKGLGKKVVELLLNRGYVVSATYRSDYRWDETFLKQYSEQLLLLEADVTDGTQMKLAISEAKTVFGSIDILINNAGPYIFERKRILDYSEEEWNTVMHGNLLNQLQILKAIVPEMRANGFGRIVNYGYSQVDHTPAWPMRGAFAAAKAGLASLTRTLAHEEAEFGITVNMICPGDIVGEMKEEDISKAKEGFGELISPVGRAGTGEDIARAVAFFIDENSDYVTGTILEINGGSNPLLKHYVHSVSKK